MGRQPDCMSGGIVTPADGVEPTPSRRQPAGLLHGKLTQAQKRCLPANVGPHGRLWTAGIGTGFQPDILLSIRHEQSFRNSHPMPGRRHRSCLEGLDIAVSACFPVAGRQGHRPRCPRRRPQQTPEPLPGLGPTTASARLASLGGAHEFDNGRQLPAWIGRVPGQYSSGGNARLGRGTRAGDNYLCSRLVMGARATLSGLGDQQDRFSHWARNLVERHGGWKAVVALAATKARLVWAVLRYGEDFREALIKSLVSCFH